MNNLIILETWFCTGLGDFYACLLSTKVAYDKLVELGHNVEVRINSERNIYGIGNEKKFLHENFNLEVFKKIEIGKEIPNNFIKLKNVQHAFNIFVHKDSILINEIDNVPLFGYSVESVATLYGGSNQEYPPKQTKSLINKKILDKVDEIYQEFGEFFTIYFRYADDKVMSKDEVDDVKKLILCISNNEKLKKVFISSKVNEIKNIEIDGIDIVNINPIKYEIEEPVVYDLINMCIFSKTNKIYSYIRHWSNYLTYSLFNNKQNKKYEEFIIENYKC